MAIQASVEVLSSYGNGPKLQIRLVQQPESAIVVHPRSTVADDAIYLVEDVKQQEVVVELASCHNFKLVTVETYFQKLGTTFGDEESASYFSWLNEGRSLVDFADLWEEVPVLFMSNVYVVDEDVVFSSTRIIFIDIKTCQKPYKKILLIILIPKVKMLD